MVSKPLLALLILPGLIMPGVAFVATQSKEVKPVTALDFDRMYQQALNATHRNPGVISKPCFVAAGQRDYRYQSCFQEMSGNATTSMQRIFDDFEQAGFERVSSSIQGGDLDASFIAKNSLYSVRITYNDRSIDWNAYDKKRGHLAPRVGHDKDAPYALSDPIDAATDVGRLILFDAVSRSSKEWLKIHPCGPASETEAAICIKADWTRAQAQKALVSRYFVNDMGYFTPLDKKATFEYREEQLMADMVKEKIADPGDTSDLLIKKLNQTTYLMRHKSDWPAYEFVFTLPAKGEKGDFKVLARRIAAPPYKP